MKVRKSISYILKVLGCALALTGAFCVIGSAGALQQDSITCSQFIIQELMAFVVIFLAIVVYLLREKFNHKYIKNFYISK